MKKIAPVLVIGGGPGGAACAIQLADRGVEVHLAEKAAFPRDKVCGCCLGGSGIETLSRLGLSDWTIANGVAINQWSACIDGHIIEMPLPTGVAISRPKLDTHLLEIAKQRGVVLHSECTAMILPESSTSQMNPGEQPDFDYGNDTVTVTLNSDPQCYASVVLAAGLNAAGLSGAGGQKLLPWIEKPHGPFGVSFTIASDDHVQPGVIYMDCNADGYVGLVQLESGRIDIAAAIQSGFSASLRRVTPLERVKNILQSSRFASLDLDAHSKVLTTPPLRRTRVAGRGRVLAIGDSAGYVEPFTGEGMTWAMKSGIAAADCIAERQSDLSQIGEVWARRSAKLLRSQKRTCRVLTSALNWSPTRRLIGLGLSTMPAIARPLVARLNRVQSD